MNTIVSKIWNRMNGKEHLDFSNDYLLAQSMIDKSTSMVDLGCGSNPHRKATVAVDKYIEPVHRKYGANKKIDVSEIERRGIKFVEADFEKLPFKDNEFELAYSHHVVEHLDNPEKALDEMMRIAESGVIICPGPMCEYMFGRAYHKWIVTSMGGRILFFEKTWGKPLFGEGPHRENGRMVLPKECNPFDILLNDTNWYHGIHRYKALSKMIRRYYYGHHRSMETTFIWKNKFEYTIYYANGDIRTSVDMR